MNLAAQDPSVESVIERKHDQFAIGNYVGPQKLEDPMLCCLHRCDVALQPLQRRSKFTARLPEYPPVVPVTSTIVDVAFRFHARQNPLVTRGEPLPNIVSRESEKINDHCFTGLIG